MYGRIDRDKYFWALFVYNKDGSEVQMQITFCIEP